LHAAVAAGAVVAILAAAAPAAAGEQAPPSAADQAQIKDVARLLDRAIERFAAGDLEAARASFEAAWRLRKDVTIASNLADVEMKLARYRDAAAHLSYCIRHSTDEGARKEAERRLEKCRQFVGSVTVTTDTPGATVSVDGASIGQAPLDGELWLEPGAHTLKAQRQGRLPAEKTLEIRSGDDVRVELKLGPSTAVAAGVTEKHVAPATPRPQMVASTRPSDGAASPSEDLKFYSIVGGSTLGAAALGLGLMWTLSANSDEDSAHALLAQVEAEGDPELAKIHGSCTAATPPAKCGDLKRTWDSIVRSRDLATGAFIVGGVLVAGTAAVYFLWPEQQQPTNQSRLRLVPWSVGKANGVQLSGSF